MKGKVSKRLVELSQPRTYSKKMAPRNFQDISQNALIYRASPRILKLSQPRYVTRHVSKHLRSCYSPLYKPEGIFSYKTSSKMLNVAEPRHYDVMTQVRYDPYSISTAALHLLPNYELPRTIPVIKYSNKQLEDILLGNMIEEKLGYAKMMPMPLIIRKSILENAPTLRVVEVGKPKKKYWDTKKQKVIDSTSPDTSTQVTPDSQVLFSEPYIPIEELPEISTSVSDNNSKSKPTSPPLKIEVETVSETIAPEKYDVLQVTNNETVSEPMAPEQPDELEVPNDETVSETKAPEQLDEVQVTNNERVSETIVLEQPDELQVTNNEKVSETIVPEQPVEVQVTYETVSETIAPEKLDELEVTNNEVRIESPLPSDINKQFELILNE